MGNLIADAPQLYAIGWTPSKNADQFSILPDFTNIPNPLNGQLLIPLSQLPQLRELAWQYHHHLVLVEDTPDPQCLPLLAVPGVPSIDLQQLLRQPGRCSRKQFDCHFCPVPVVLERFHESYVKNYINSFQYYGIRALAYPKIEQYIRSQCSNRFLVCSNYELDQLSFKMRGRPGASDPAKRLTVLCFCNRQEYVLSPRVELFLKREGIDLLFFQNILDIIERVAGDRLIPTPTITPTPTIQPRTERIFFYLSDKQKQADYLTKMSRRLQRAVRSATVEKVTCPTSLVDKVEKLTHAIIVVSGQAKEARSCFQLFERLEREGLEDRVILVRRDNQITDKLTQHIYSLTEKPKFRKCSLLEKNLVFFGPPQAFKAVLRTYPSLKFKRFVNCLRQREKLLPFLEVPTEVVLSSIRLCPCQEQFSQVSFRCRVVLLRGKFGTGHALDRTDSSPSPSPPQSSPCEQEQWCTDEEEVMQLFKEGCVGVAFPWQGKKVSYLSRGLHDSFSRMKQKKTILYNRLNDSMFLFSTEYYTLDQLAASVMRFLSARNLGNYEHECMLDRMRAGVYNQLAFLVRSRRVEAAVLETLDGEGCQDVFALAERTMGLMLEFSELLEEVNSIWSLLLYQDRKEHPTPCQHLLFLLLLSFNKTSLLKYNDHSLQGLTLILRRCTTAYQPDNLLTFRSKNRNSFVYNVEFLSCDVAAPGEKADSGDTIIRVEGSELTSFAMWVPLWRNGQKALLCPFSKFQLVVGAEGAAALRLSVNSQHKLLQKISQTFLEENTGQLKLFGQEREVRKFDAFLDSMAHSKFETAGYLLKKLAKEESMANQDCINAFTILYHLKRGELEMAQKRLRADKYEEVLGRVVRALREQAGGQGFSSSKRIEQPGGEYQNLQETSNDGESIDSAMMRTDPDTVKQLSSEYRLHPHPHLRNRSPSSKIKDSSRQRRPQGKVAIRRKQQVSISDELSECGPKGKEKEKDKLNIVILPPIRHLSKKSKQFSEAPVVNPPHPPTQLSSSTYGGLLMTEYSCISSKEERKGQTRGSREMRRLKSTRSDNAEPIPIESDAVIESSPVLKKVASRRSHYFNPEPPMEEHIEDEGEHESRDQLLSLLDPTPETQNEQTGNFNFVSTQPEQPIEEGSQNSIHQLPEEDEEEEESHSATSESSQDKSKNQPPPEKLFPIKKEFFSFSRNSLAERVEGQGLVESPLRRIQQQRSSQMSITPSTAKFLISSPDKENQVQRQPRVKENKLFTFYKISDPLKPRFSLSSNKNSLNLSTSELQCINQQGEQGDEPLFSSFQKDQFEDINSISSIDIEEAEQVFPEELAIAEDLAKT